jgi:FAD-dependent urate hydroxylase
MHANTLPVVVVGAGPYGLSLAAHLQRNGIETRVFGEPMGVWRRHMPERMFLKSTAGASSLSAPVPGFTLDDFCAEVGLAPLDEREPVPIDLFVRYGLWFQQRLVPACEQVRVDRLARADSGFDLLLDSGEKLRAEAVIVATGHADFAHLPEELARLVPDGASPSGPISHSSQHRDFSAFSGASVGIVGGGQSALETAALIHEAGGHVHVIARALKLLWADPPSDAAEALQRRLLKPQSALGPGWSLYAVSRAPGLVRSLPSRSRLFLVRAVLGPSGAWWLRDRVVGQVDLKLGWRLDEARLRNGTVTLRLRDGEANPAELSVDHVVAATGYSVNLNAISFLDHDLLHRLKRVGGSPRLTASFESSVPGLFFTGLSAAATFGPVLRFVCGADFAARRSTRALAARSSRRSGWS